LRDAALDRRHRGAGMSAYAVLARAWGAEVRAGIDAIRRTSTSSQGSTSRSRTNRLSRGWLGGVRVHRVHGARPGKSRAELLASCCPCATRSSVAGRPRQDDDERHDRVLPQRARPQPAWLIGADVPQLGGNAGTGVGWLVVEETNRIERSPSCAHAIAVVRTSTSTITRRSARTRKSRAVRRLACERPLVVREKGLVLR